MSKQIKQMQMDVLTKDFEGVNTMVFLTAKGIDALTNNAMRLGLRKKNIRLQVVKNSLMRRVFGQRGVTVSEEIWSGPTMIAWGGDSVKGLSKEIETHLKDPKLKDKLAVKSVLADGATTTFAAALTMPTRLEAIGEIIAALTGPGGQIASCITSPGGQVASQIKTIAEKAETPAA